MDLQPWIRDIESRIDENEEQAIVEAWTDYAHGRNKSAPFEAPRRTPRKSSLEWRHVCVNDALADPELMKLSQLEAVNRQLEQGDNRILRMRANYGVGNMALLFGAEPFVMPYEYDELPNVRAVGREGIERVAASPVPDVESGAAKVFAFARWAGSLKEEAPRLDRFLMIEAPDLQGPIDVCELLWGSDMFYAFYDEPELLHALLRKVTDAYRAFIEKWYEYLPQKDGLCRYFGHVARGRIFLRDDSASNMTPGMFDEFVAPYDGELLAAYGGGVHFCGRGDHFIDSLSRLEGLTAVNMSQPHLNDMQKILACTVDRGVNLSISAKYAPEGRHDLARLTFA